jgi:hypothetical protein
MQKIAVGLCVLLALLLSVVVGLGKMTYAEGGKENWGVQARVSLTDSEMARLVGGATCGPCTLEHKCNNMPCNEPGTSCNNCD